MLRSSLAPAPGLVMFQALSRRQKIARRRTFLVATFAGLAMLSAAIGMLDGGPRTGQAETGAFSYFPAE